ncbi:MAG: YdcF family protein [Acidobacteriota bacterium]|nr:YdcF family protein [Acidobacteriota bacterium]
MRATGRSGERGGIFFRLVFLLFLACFAFVIYLARHPLMRLAGNFWVVDDGTAPADAIVILADDNYQGDRATLAAELLKAGWAPRIIASGRYLRPYASIAQLEQLDLIDRAVPANDIVLLTHRAENTHEEAEAIAQFVSAHGWKRILVVTSNYHTRRARYILARVLPAGTEVRLIPARDSEYDPNNWWRTRAGTKIFFREAGGMALAMWELRHQDPRTAKIGSTWPDLGGISELYRFGTTGH